MTMIVSKEEVISHLTMRVYELKRRIDKIREDAEMLRELGRVMPLDETGSNAVLRSAESIIRELDFDNPDNK